jgi:hypothetical protein
MLHPLRRKICSMLDNGDKIPGRNRDLLCRAERRRATRSALQPTNLVNASPAKASDEDV